jgi:hypothetical protein
MKPFRPVYIAIVAAWLTVAFLGFGYLVLVAACPSPASNMTSGDLGWSVLPPGPKCTWNEAEHGVSGSDDGPGPVMSVWIVSLVLLGFGAKKTRGAPRPGSGVRISEALGLTNDRVDLAASCDHRRSAARRCEGR